MIWYKSLEFYHILSWVCCGYRDMHVFTRNIALHYLWPWYHSPICASSLNKHLPRNIAMLFLFLSRFVEVTFHQGFIEVIFYQTFMLVTFYLLFIDAGFSPYFYWGVILPCSCWGDILPCFYWVVMLPCFYWGFILPCFYWGDAEVLMLMSTHGALLDK